MVTAMQDNKRKEFSIFVVFISVLFGFVIRLAPAVMAGSPINDGGLFYQMTREVLINHYRLPLFTDYNRLSIPFSYPPLGFYLIAAIQTITGADLYKLFHYFPGILATLIIPAMYFFSSRLLKDNLRGAVAAFFFSVIPVSFNLPFMGGGVPRSLGMSFLLLALGFLYLLITTQETRYILLTSLFSGLLVLSHPEAAYHAVFGGLLFLAFFGRNRTPLLLSALVVAVTLVLTAPWWAFILLHHGLTPFLNAIRGRPRDSLALLYMFQFNLTGEPLLTVIGVMAAAGLILSLKRREFFLPAWIGLSFLVSPRAAPYSVVFPAVLLAVIGFEFVVRNLDRLYNSRAYLMAFMAFMVYCLASGLTAGLRIAYEQRTLPEELMALDWIAEATPSDSRFIVLTGASSPANDPISEWFPALTDRASLATVQGREWTSQKTMTSAWIDYVSLQNCLSAGPNCVVEWAVRNHVDFSHIYIRKLHPLADGSTQSVIAPIEILLRASPDYQVVYDTPAAVVFYYADEADQ